MKALLEVVILPVIDPDRFDLDVITIGGFAAAALEALKWPVVAMALICLCLVGYIRPDIPEPQRAPH